MAVDLGEPLALIETLSSRLELTDADIGALSTALDTRIGERKRKERKKSLTRGHVKDIVSTVGIQSYP